MRILTAIGCLLFVTTLVSARPDVSHLAKQKKSPTTETRKETTFMFKPKSSKGNGVKNDKFTEKLTTTTTTTTTTTAEPLRIIVEERENEEEEAEQQNEKIDFSTWDIRSNIPGDPGVDYPIYFQSPETSFDCKDRHDGYYADVEARCQVFHVCANTKLKREGGFEFLCPNGTVFSQQSFVCDWYPNVNCHESETYYSINEELNKIITSEEEMLAEVQRMFNYTLQALIDNHLGRIKNIDIEDAKNEKLNTLAEQKVKITKTGGKPQLIGVRKSSPKPKSSTTTTTTTTRAPTKSPSPKKTDKIFISNLGELSTDVKPDFDVDTIKEKRLEQQKRDNSFAQLWKQDPSELDEILNYNRLKKQTPTTPFTISRKSSSQAPVVSSTISRRDVSHLSSNNDYLPPSKHTYLPPGGRKINLRPQTQTDSYSVYETTKSLTDTSTRPTVVVTQRPTIISTTARPTATIAPQTYETIKTVTSDRDSLSLNRPKPIATPAAEKRPGFVVTEHKEIESDLDFRQRFRTDEPSSSSAPSIVTKTQETVIIRGDQPIHHADYEEQDDLDQSINVNINNNRPYIKSTTETYVEDSYDDSNNNYNDQSSGENFNNNDNSVNTLFAFSTTIKNEPEILDYKDENRTNIISISTTEGSSIVRLGEDHEHSTSLDNREVITASSIEIHDLQTEAPIRVTSEQPIVMMKRPILILMPPYVRNQTYDDQQDMIRIVEKTQVEKNYEDDQNVMVVLPGNITESNQIYYEQNENDDAQEEDIPLNIETEEIINYDQDNQEQEVQIPIRFGGDELSGINEYVNEYQEIENEQPESVLSVSTDDGDKYNYEQEYNEEIISQSPVSVSTAETYEEEIVTTRRPALVTGGKDIIITQQKEVISSSQGPAQIASVTTTSTRIGSDDEHASGSHSSHTSTQRPGKIVQVTTTRTETPQQTPIVSVINNGRDRTTTGGQTKTISTTQRYDSSVEYDDDLGSITELNQIQSVTQTPGPSISSTLISNIETIKTSTGNTPSAIPTKADQNSLLLLPPFAVENVTLSSKITGPTSSDEIRTFTVNNQEYSQTIRPTIKVSTEIIDLEDQDIDIQGISIGTGPNAGTIQIIQNEDVEGTNFKSGRKMISTDSRFGLSTARPIISSTVVDAENEVYIDEKDLINQNININVANGTYEARDDKLALIQQMIKILEERMRQKESGEIITQTIHSSTGRPITHSTEQIITDTSPSKGVGANLLFAMMKILENANNQTLSQTSRPGGGNSLAPIFSSLNKIQNPKTLQLTDDEILKDEDLLANTINLLRNSEEDIASILDLNDVHGNSGIDITKNLIQIQSTTSPRPSAVPSTPASFSMNTKQTIISSTQRPIVLNENSNSEVIIEESFRKAEEQQNLPSRINTDDNLRISLLNTKTQSSQRPISVVTPVAPAVSVTRVTSGSVTPSITSTQSSILDTKLEGKFSGFLNNANDTTENDVLSSSKSKGYFYENKLSPDVLRLYNTDNVKTVEHTQTITPKPKIVTYTGSPFMVSTYSDGDSLASPKSPSSTISQSTSGVSSTSQPISSTGTQFISSSQRPIVTSTQQQPQTVTMTSQVLTTTGRPFISSTPQQATNFVVRVPEKQTSDNFGNRTSESRDVLSISQNERNKNLDNNVAILNSQQGIITHPSGQQTTTVQQQTSRTTPQGVSSTFGPTSTLTQSTGTQSTSRPIVSTISYTGSGEFTQSGPSLTQLLSSQGGGVKGGRPINQQSHNLVSTQSSGSSEEQIFITQQRPVSIQQERGGSSTTSRPQFISTQNSGSSSEEQTFVRQQRPQNIIPQVIPSHGVSTLLQEQGPQIAQGQQSNFQGYSSDRPISQGGQRTPTITQSHGQSISQRPQVQQLPIPSGGTSTISQSHGQPNQNQGNFVSQQRIPSGGSLNELISQIEQQPSGGSSFSTQIQGSQQRIPSAGQVSQGPQFTSQVQQHQIPSGGQGQINSQGAQQQRIPSGGQGQFVTQGAQIEQQRTPSGGQGQFVSQGPQFTSQVQQQPIPSGGQDQISLQGPQVQQQRIPSGGQNQFVTQGAQIEQHRIPSGGQGQFISQGAQIEQQRIPSGSQGQFVSQGPQIQQQQRVPSGGQGQFVSQEAQVPLQQQQPIQSSGQGQFISQRPQVQQQQQIPSGGQGQFISQGAQIEQQRIPSGNQGQFVSQGPQIQQQQQRIPSGNQGQFVSQGPQIQQQRIPSSAQGQFNAQTQQQQQPILSSAQGQFVSQGPQTQQQGIQSIGQLHTQVQNLPIQHGGQGPQVQQQRIPSSGQGQFVSQGPQFTSQIQQQQTPAGGQSIQQGQHQQYQTPSGGSSSITQTHSQSISSQGQQHSGLNNNLIEQTQEIDSDGHVIVKIVPSYNWYLNDEHDRGSFYDALQRGIIVNEQQQLEQQQRELQQLLQPQQQQQQSQQHSQQPIQLNSYGHRIYGVPSEYQKDTAAQNRRSFQPPTQLRFNGYDIQDRGSYEPSSAHAFPPRRNFDTSFRENSNRRVDDVNNVSYEEDTVFRGLTSYNAPIASVGKLPCDSDSVSGRNIKPARRDCLV